VNIILVVSFLVEDRKEKVTQFRGRGPLNDLLTISFINPSG
jgi:hypothetical protein